MEPEWNDDLLAVKRIAVPGAVVQMALATVLGMSMAWWWRPGGKSPYVRYRTVFAQVDA